MDYKEKYEICKSKLFMLSCHIESTLAELDEATKRVAKLDKMIEALPDEIKTDIFGSEYQQIMKRKQ